MRKFFAFLISTLVIAACTPPDFDDGLNNDSEENVNGTEGTESSDDTNVPKNMIYYTTADGEILTPNEVDSYTFGATLLSNTYENGVGTLVFDGDVKTIGYNAFEDCSALTSVTIPDGVTSIDIGAFWGCTGLTSITIPNSVTSIGAQAFLSCSSLTSITVPNSITHIGNDALSGTDWYNNQPNGVIYVGKLLYEYKGTMPKNTHIIVKDGTLGIANEAFYGCSGLTSITIPNSVTNIANNAFSGCSDLTSITIPNSVTSIGESAFNNCSSLKELYIEDGINMLSLGCNFYGGASYVSEGLFYDCPLEKLYLGRNLSYDTFTGSPFDRKETLISVTISNSVTSIESYAFYKCSGLTSIEIPNSVTSIESYAFMNCSGLTSITIPNSVTSIEDAAFHGCTGLTSITIPNSVISIEGMAFGGCSVLESIVVDPDNAKYDSRENCNAIIETESNTLIASCKNSVIPNSVTSIGYGAFSGCSGLTSITIPNSVTSIGFSAFSGCSDLTSITIPNSVTRIGYYVFSGCTGLTSITIPNSVTSIGEDAFYGCKGLKEVHIIDLDAWKNISFGEGGNPLYYGAKLYLNGVEVTDY